MRRPQITQSLFDRAATAISPSWGLGRLNNKLKIAAYSENGYIVPGSRRKSMKGVTATAGSPDRDVDGKLSGIRAIQRDMFMNSPLAVSILRRHKIDVINFGLQLQAIVDYETLGISEKQAQKIERLAEFEFELWAESFFCDYSEQLVFGEMQAVAFLNMLLSGDCWMISPFEDPIDADHPYSTRLKLIDADLVRDPSGTEYTGRDIKNGVERDSKGRTVAIHVWNTYENDTSLFFTGGTSISKSERLPVYSPSGKRQVWHIADFERLNQRRGISLLAPAVEPLKQITRLSEAQLMNALVASFFSVFVRDSSGMGALMSPAMAPEETLFGGGRYTPDGAQVEAVDQDNGNDLEMGSGNINYLDENTDISIADPKKVDTGFDAFWSALGNQVAAAGGIPFEKAMMKYTTSYTAARAAANDSWRQTGYYRKLIDRRFCSIAYQLVFEEAVTRGRIDAPRYFDDARYKKAWTGSRWIGVGQGSLDPLKDARATEINMANFTTTHEDEYQQRTGGRWENAMGRRLREESLLESYGLKTEPKPIEPQQNDTEEDDEQGTD